MPDTHRRNDAEAQNNVSVRILWPALGFPAVIAPRDPPSESAMRECDATRCICLLLLSNQRYLSKRQVANSLRYVPWIDRGRRFIPAGEAGSFREEDLVVHNFSSDSRFAQDKFGINLPFGANEDDKNGVLATLAKYVRNFYRKLPKRRRLTHFHEIRVYERASGQLADGKYHLFWNNRRAKQNAPSDELQLLLDQFALPRRKKIRWLWDQKASFLRREYEFEYGVVHPPYSLMAMRKTRYEILHPLFVKRPASQVISIGHLTDLHVSVRADVYERNLVQRRMSGVSFNNWNKSASKLYEDAQEACDVVLLTGDLIDYGRGHWGTNANELLGEDRLYQVDRNWLLFYDFLASGGSYQKPVYTILGNHDWRINPYPPFAPGSPSPQTLIHNYRKLVKGKTKKQAKAYLQGIIRRLHGPGHHRKFSYYGDSEDDFVQRMWKSGGILKALKSLLMQKGTLDLPHVPTETTTESVAWYLLTINPFFDYSFSLPSGHHFLMLDWGEDENVLQPIVRNGIRYPLRLSVLGPRPRKSLTSLQLDLAESFVTVPGKAKVVGIHAPIIGPYPVWSNQDLRNGKKIYRKKTGIRGPRGGHRIYAVRPKGGAHGMVADYGSITKNRTRIIKAMARSDSGVRLVLAGHIHRNGLFVVHKSGRGSKQKLLVRGVTPAQVRGAAPPAVSTTTQGKHGPLYVNTTSAGPRGNYTPVSGRHRNINPGYARIELHRDGTIQNVSFHKAFVPVVYKRRPRPVHP